MVNKDKVEEMVNKACLSEIIITYYFHTMFLKTKVSKTRASKI
jgi:hypothetical protein